jgi:hypothetical protein
VIEVLDDMEHMKQDTEAVYQQVCSTCVYPATDLTILVADRSWCVTHQLPPYRRYVVGAGIEDNLEEDFVLDFGRETISGHVVGVNMSWSV